MKPEDLREGYVGWHPQADCMWKDSKGFGGWESTLVIKSEDWIKQWLPIDPDYNVIVDFYFYRETPAECCRKCGGTGYNEATKKIADAFYNFDNTGNRWCDRLTDDEIEALMKFRKLTREEAVKRMKGEKCLGMDALDRHMLIEVRAKRLGVWGHCEKCGGKGEIATEPEMLVLCLWMTHPRKGASRGIKITHVKEEHLPIYYRLLRDAGDKLAQRFKNVPDVEVDRELYYRGFPDIAGAVFNPK